MSGGLLVAIAIVILIALSAFFVIVEFALLGARRHRLEATAATNRSARAALKGVNELTLMLAGAIVISLERHRRLTPVTAIVTGLGTLAVVLGSITATAATIDPATADTVPRGVTINQLPERVTDFDLPTL